MTSARAGWGQLAAGLALMLLGVLLHTSGLYSDIGTLYVRDQLWRHPAPYFDYPLEYPVLLGLLIWLLGFAKASAAVYYLATAVVLVAAGALTLGLVRRFEGANPWLLALSPTLALYVGLNWDMVAILATVAALLLLRRGRDGWGALALAAAVWTKFFPLAIVPLVLLDRAARRRWRDLAAFGAVFAAATLAINAPVALELGPGGARLRDSWLHFFRFNQGRRHEANLYYLLEQAGLPLSTAQVNLASAALLLAGLAVALLLVWYARARGAAPGSDLVLPATLLVLGWWFLVNKVYSPQYSLWLAALLALLGARPLLAVAFGAADLTYFVAILVAIAQHGWSNWFNAPVLLLPTALREAAILALVAWAGWRIVRPAVAASREAARRPVPTPTGSGAG